MSPKLDAEVHYTFEVTLRGAAPPVWRRVRVPGSISLAQFHDILETALGWWDGHGHVLRTEHERWGEASPEAQDVQDEDAVTVRELVEKARRFVYDLGPGREHDVVFEAQGTGPIGRICLDGEHEVPDPTRPADRRLHLETVEMMLQAVARDWRGPDQYKQLPSRKIRELWRHVDAVCRRDGPRAPVALPAELVWTLLQELVDARAAAALNEGCVQMMRMDQRRFPRRRPRSPARVPSKRR